VGNGGIGVEEGLEWLAYEAEVTQLSFSRRTLGTGGGGGGGWFGVD
jgi:hypothetical protein